MAVGLWGGRDEGRTDRGTSRLRFSSASLSYGKETASHVNDLIFGEGGVGKVDTVPAIDLDIDESRRHNHFLGINHYVGYHVMALRFAIKIRLGIQNLPVRYPQISGFDLDTMDSTNLPCRLGKGDRWSRESSAALDLSGWHNAWTFH